MKIFPLSLGVRHELEVERGRLQQLQNDFQYNLSLLADRDRELSHYDSAFGEVRRTVTSLLAENSELKVCGEWVLKNGLNLWYKIKFFHL